MPIQSVNPTNNKIIKSYDAFDSSVIESMLEQSAEAFEYHKKTSFDERAHKINAVADYLDENAETLGALIVQEMGKPIALAVGEVKKCATLCRYYAENAEKFLAEKPLETEKGNASIKYLPIGAILAVMPWNFPFWQVFRFAVPALMAGNVCLLKHASNVPQCALEIEKIFNQCGFMHAEFQTLMIGSDQVGSVIADPRVAAVTLTGSEGAGSKVAQAAGKYLKKSVLELGGSDPFIVMKSADLDEAVKMAVKGRIYNNGQTCIASKRYIVEIDIYDEFKIALISAFRALKVGDPMDENTDIGPLATPDIRDELNKQVMETINKGAECLCGAHIIEGNGNYYQPGLLENIPKDSPGYKDELFGPVGLLFKAKDIEDAVRIANDTRFGLGSVLFSNDKEEIEYATNHIQAGATFVNTLMVSDPAMPFGGTKSSGYGRELSKEGIHEFCNIKTVYIAKV